MRTAEGALSGLCERTIMPRLCISLASAWAIWRLSVSLMSGLPAVTQLLQRRSSEVTSGKPYHVRMAWFQPLSFASVRKRR